MNSSVHFRGRLAIGDALVLFAVRRATWDPLDTPMISITSTGKMLLMMFSVFAGQHRDEASVQPRPIAAASTLSSAPPGHARTAPAR